MKPRDHGDVAPWLALADADLALADMAIAAERATQEILGLACFHCQQAAEKRLKALLVSLKLATPRSHSLVLLLELCLEDAPEEARLKTQ